MVFLGTTDDDERLIRITARGHRGERMHSSNQAVFVKGN